LESTSSIAVCKCDQYSAPLTTQNIHYQDDSFVYRLPLVNLAGGLSRSDDVRIDQIAASPIHVIWGVYLALFLVQLVARAKNVQNSSASALRKRKPAF
jgi:hypothetical protein